MYDDMYNEHRALILMSIGNKGGSILQATRWNLMKRSLRTLSHLQSKAKLSSKAEPSSLPSLWSITSPSLRSMCHWPSQGTTSSRYSQEYARPSDSKWLRWIRTSPLLWIRSHSALKRYYRDAFPSLLQRLVEINLTSHRYQQYDCRSLSTRWSAVGRLDSRVSMERAIGYKSFWLNSRIDFTNWFSNYLRIRSKW